MSSHPSPHDSNWFPKARLGLFIHYGLYSLLERGEWVLNREQIPLDDYKPLADRFTAAKFDADAICRLARRAGMNYIIFTSMHHDGFRLYDTQLSNFNSVRTAARRDLVQEMIDAARRHGLRFSFYHSLNNWMDKPDAADALESKPAYETFIQNTFERLREVNERYKPFDVMWYDGWWPYNAQQWRAVEMNDMVRRIQPHILFNGRNGLPGDFATPENHITAPTPWRPWEACMTLSGNWNWGWHAGDHNWKTPGQLVDLLARCASGVGNLVLNIGLKPDGSIPDPARQAVETFGDWVARHRPAMFDTEPFGFDLREKGAHRGDWSHNGLYTVSGNSLFYTLRSWPGREFALGGVQGTIRRVSFLSTHQDVKFRQNGTRLLISDLPATDPDPVCSVLRIEFDDKPMLYLCGGIRVPTIPHPHYDPCESDIAH